VYKVFNLTDNTWTSQKEKPSQEFLTNLKEQKEKEIDDITKKALQIEPLAEEGDEAAEAL